MSPLDLRFLVVTGKGGVGKSTVAAAAAQVAAGRGRSVLLCDMDASGALAHAFGSDASGYEPVSVAPGVDVMQMHTGSALRDYLATFMPFAGVTRIGPLARALELMGGAAPGVREVLALGKLLWLIRENDYDLVIMDGPATGHIVAHLASPASVGELAAGGMLAEQTGWMLEMLGDESMSGVVVVTLPEEGPAGESALLLEALRSETVAPVVGCVMNRMPEPLGSRADRRILEALVGVTKLDNVSRVTGALLAQRVSVDTRQQQAAGWARQVATASVPSLSWALPAVFDDVALRLTETIDDEW